MRKPGEKKAQGAISRLHPQEPAEQFSHGASWRTLAFVCGILQFWPHPLLSYSRSRSSCGGPVTSNHRNTLKVDTAQVCWEAQPMGPEFTHFGPPSVVFLLWMNFL